MADKTLGTVVSDEAILAMADEAVHETAPIMADEVPVVWTDEAHVDMTGVAPVDMAHEIVAVMADGASVGVAHIGTEIASIMADEASVDVDSVDSEETILAEPQPLQIIPFASQHDEPRIIDLVGSHANLPFARMASIIEGISLFGVAPRFERVLREEDPPVVVGDHSLSGALIGSQVHALEGALIQDVDGGGMANTEVHGVETVPAGDISLVDESGKAPALVEKEDAAHVFSAVASSSQTYTDGLHLITPKGWSSHLADVLWAYRGSPKTATGFTPFSLVYGTDVISPPELLVPSPRILQGMELEADIEICTEARAADLESLDESRELALTRNLRYHQKLANAYGKTVQNRVFSLGQMVLKTADHVRRGLPSPSKFTPNWERPYVIREAHDSGYYRLSKADGTILVDPINGKWLKRYYS
uniref:Uncharacterized protein n=1 Tax=Fagus sylvatica TaxID=28930 RepID=A0A2N9IAK4_FAGSY